MVRETRHLWVGNLPDNIREEKIREHFKRYGRVQSVKILARSKEEVALGGTGVCATVSFMDIKSASKAHNVDQKMDDQSLSTEYHEPAAIPSASPTLPPHLYPATARPYIHGSPLEELSSFERSSHFYDREREASYRGRPPAPGYHVVSPIQGSPDPLRTRPRDRAVFRAYPALDSVVTTSRGHHHRVGSWAYEANNPRFAHHLSSCSSPDLSYSEDRRVEPPLIIVRNKPHIKPPSEPRSEEDRSGSPSSSSSTVSQSGASSSCSSSSSPSPQLPRSPSPGPALSDKSSSSHSLHGSSKSSTVPSHANCAQLPNSDSQTSLSALEQQRHNAICIKNLPSRSSDTSLKDGLYHEYKRHGKVTCVKVVGQGSDRYALVFFKKTEDVDKALQVSHDKSFFGTKIEVSAYQGHKDVDDNESRPIETDVDEFHSKATRTLFIGNLNSNTMAADLRKHFETFGEIIEIDIKKGNNINGSTAGTYAFVQYIDISSVVKAMRTMDGEFLSGHRINLGFGKSLATTCVWIDGVAESVSEKYLASHFNQFGSVTHCVIDRSREHALVFFQQITHAQLAVTQMRGSIMKGRRLQVDFASRECQQGFYEHLDKTSSESSPRFTSQQHDNTAQLSPGSTNGVAIRGFETPSSSCSSAAGDKSYPRNPDEPRTSSISVPNPQDMHNLQKERVSLLEQLEDCNSSGDEILNDSSKAQQVKSRSSTPICDERPPESLTPPSQVPRSHVPISLPLPRFAVHVSNPLLSPPLSSPRRPQSSNSDDSQASDPGAPGLEERLRNLDEKYEQWSGSRTSVLKLDTSVRLRSRYKLLDTVDKLEPSDIVKSVLAKPSVFDEDTKRLENFSDKYIPKEFVPSRTSPNLQNFRQQQIGSFSPLTPSSSGSSKSPPASSPAAVKTQYSFPSHPQPLAVTQNSRTSPTEIRLTTTDPRLIDPRLADPRLSADSRGSFLTKQNICTINDNRYVPDILNTKDPRHPIHKDAEIKDGPEAFYRSKIRDEYTKNWLHTFERKDIEPTYRLVDTFDRRRFSDYRKEEDEKLKMEQINKQKLLDGFIIKRKTSMETIVHPSPFFVGVQEKPKQIDDTKKLVEHKKIEEIPKREERVEMKRAPEEIKPPEPPPTVNSIEEEKIDFITNENTIANILLSSIENLHKKTETEETRSKIDRTNSNESVNKHLDTEKKKEIVSESTKKKEHERKKSIDFEHPKVKEKKDHESKKILNSTKLKECENGKSKELEFNMFEINRINNKKREELSVNGKTKDNEKKKDLLKSDKKPEAKKEDKKKDIIKETDKKDDVDKVKEKKKDKPKNKKKKDKKGSNGKVVIDIGDLYEDQPIFGVPLEISFDRNPCHDDIHLPLILRNCIDYVQMNGLCTDGVYKVPGVKSKVQSLKVQYNRRQSVNLADYDLAVVTSLLKQYLRELPDPILTTDLLSKFEDAAETQNIELTKSLISKLPLCNKHTLTWLIVHFTSIIENEKYTKMNTTNFGCVLCPVLQMSQRLFSFFITKRNDLFSGAILHKYIPPLRCASPYLPSGKQEMTNELKKQESLLGYIHREMNAGFVCKTKEEELWDVQRIITQLKRKLKVLEKDSHKVSKDKIKKEDQVLNGKFEEVGTQTVLGRQNSNNSASGKAEVGSITSDTFNISNCEGSLVDEEVQTTTSDSDNEELVLQYESEELMSLITNLKDCIVQEKCEIDRLHTKLVSVGKNINIREYFMYPIDETTITNNTLLSEYKMLQFQKVNLLKSIEEEREAILDLKIQIKLAQRKHMAIA